MPLDPAILFSAVLNGSDHRRRVRVGGAGLTLIYGVLHIINFAHGAALMVALYAVYLLNQRLGLDPYAALPLVMAGMFALGYLLQRLVINRASHGKDENILLVTLGLSIVLENLALVWFKSDTRSIDTPYALSTVEIRPALIALPKLIAFGGALAVAACLLWLIRGTDLGAPSARWRARSRAPGSWASTWKGSTRCRSASAWPAWARPPVSCCRRTTSIRRSAAASCWWPSPSWCWAAWAASPAHWPAGC